ncbi:hypothetical protein [Flavobacterium sp.]|uniref:hypothetical protein n=1 Tax=Flavobacterium sp. TaxID=239 RepID=UPI00261A65B4|nr:hypothetical protein [Flavobacterium sp.]
MKKRLEAELISIAHRVLKLKNKSEIDQLYHETQKLYEALTVLKFYGDNYEQVKSEISNEDIEEKIESFVENKTVVATPKVVVEETVEAEEQKEEIVAEVEKVVEQETVTASEETEVQEEAIEEEPVIVGEITLEEEDEIDEEEVPVGEAKGDLDFEPIFELAAETPVETEEVEKPKVEEPKKETQQISFEDLLGQNYTEPVFVKPNDVVLPTPKKEVFEKSDDVIVDRFEGKTPSLNDKLSKTINIGLNDRMGFVKFLFADSNEDYNRVLSQLNTFSTFREAKDFIDEIIKPDYNNWVGADDYADRFIELVEKKFL